MLLVLDLAIIPEGDHTGQLVSVVDLGASEGLVSVLIHNSLGCIRVGASASQRVMGGAKIGEIVAHQNAQERTKGSDRAGENAKAKLDISPHEELVVKPIQLVGCLGLAHSNENDKLGDGGRACTVIRLWLAQELLQTS